MIRIWNFLKKVWAALTTSAVVGTASGSGEPGAGWGAHRVPILGILLLAAYLIGVTGWTGWSLWESFPPCSVSGLIANRLSPKQALTAGGEQLRIEGEGFHPGITVRIGDQDVPVSVNNPFELTVQTPRRAAGRTRVIVSASDLPPVDVPGGVEYVDKRSAVVANATPRVLLTDSSKPQEVRILGENFRAGAQVRVGNDPLPTMFLGPTELVATVSKHAAGVVQATIVQEGDPAVEVPDGLQFVDTAPSPPPAAQSALLIATIEPSSTGIGGGDAVTITGTGFTANTLVRFGGLPARSVRIDSTRIITAVTPMHRPGAVSVVVANDQAISSLEGRFSFVCPPIPDNTMVWMVILAGALGGLVHALRSFVWYVGQRELVWSWVAMYVLLPFTASALGFVFFLIIRAGLYQPSGGTSFLLVGLAALVGMFSTQAAEKLKKVAEGIFTETPRGKDDSAPGSASTAVAITVVKPVSGPISGGTVVTITGTGFTAQSAVRFGQSASPGVTVVNTTTIKAVTPARGTAGNVDVGVTVPGKSEVVKTGGFAYVAPQGKVTKMDPAEGPVAGGTQVTITGEQFTKDIAVTFGEKPGTAVTFIDPTTVKVTTPSQAKPGAVDVRLDAAADLIGVLAGGFTYK
jgi:IPT/TIG domain